MVGGLVEQGLQRPHLPKPKTNFGPKRQRRYSKPKQFINSRVARPYESAVARAAAIPGIAFTFLTVWWGGCNHPCRDADEAREWLLEAIRHWMQLHGHTPFYALWAVEIGEIKGIHLHALIHCPKWLRPDFHKWLRRQMKPNPKSKAMKREKTHDGQDCPG